MKIGDKVKIIKCTSWCEGRGHEGKVGRISYVFLGGDVQVELNRSHCVSAKVELISPKKKVSKPTKRIKNTIYKIESTKVENGWDIRVCFDSKPAKYYIAKNLAKFIEKKTK